MACSWNASGNAYGKRLSEKFGGLKKLQAAVNMVKILQTGRSIRAVTALARIHRYRADRVGIARRIQIGK